METKGYASVEPNLGRSSCKWVQLWENGPRWAEFNVGATIESYSELVSGKDVVEGSISLYNTNNVGGLYAWDDIFINVRTGVDSSAELLALSGEFNDSISIIWGRNWRTPSYEEFRDLMDTEKTIWEWCDGEKNQILPNCPLKGMKISGVGDYASNFIFLPAANHYSPNSGGIVDSSFFGYYWTNMNDNDFRAFGFHFSPMFSNFSVFSVGEGLSFRAVLV